ncbi:MAG: OsmC family protein [Planctomycetota bacterium]
MYRVEVTNTDSNSAFKVKSKDYEFIIDTKGKGITPPDTLLASLGGCIGVYLRKYLEGYKLAIDDFSITVESNLSGNQPVSFKDINVSIDLKGLQIDEHKQARLLEFIKNCPIHNTLEAKPRIGIKLVS